MSGAVHHHSDTFTVEH